MTLKKIKPIRKLSEDKMFKKKLTTLAFISLSSAVLFSGANAKSETMNDGEIMLRTDFAYTTASSLTVGTVQVPINSGNRNEIAGALSGFFGLQHGFQLDTRLVYTSSTVTNLSAPFVGHNSGDTVSSLSSATFALDKEIYKTEGFDLVGTFSVKAPANTNNNPNDLLATDDGLTTYGFGVTGTYRIIPEVSIIAGLQYLKRTGPDPVSDRINITASLPINVIKGLQFGPTFGYLQTFSGYDVLDAGFVAAIPSAGGAPFPRTKEGFTTLGGFVGAPVCSSVSADVFFVTKVASHNSDNGSTYGLGVNYAL